ncbi:hypothetical protein ABIE40_004086 [Rhizobium sp. OAE497]
MAIPSVLWVTSNGTYCLPMVETIPTPMNSMAIIPIAISQCNRRWAAEKRVFISVMALRSLLFEDSGSPRWF